MKTTTDFAILDVQRNRKKLAKAIEDGKKFRVNITGVIDEAHSNDDGVSIEFSVQVEDHKIEEIK